MGYHHPLWVGIISQKVLSAPDRTLLLLDEALFESWVLSYVLQKVLKMGRGPCPQGQRGNMHRPGLVVGPVWRCCREDQCSLDFSLEGIKSGTLSNK